MSQPNALHPVDQMLPPGKTALFAVQHLLVAVLGAIPVPLIIGGMAHADAKTMAMLISATLFVGGIASLLQSFGILNFAGAKVPAVMGVSFAVVSACVVIVTNPKLADVSLGFREIAGASIVAGIAGLAIAPLWKHMSRFFPLVVVGTVVTVIGISLLSVPVGWISGFTNGVPNAASVQNILLALFVFFLVVVFSKFLKGFSASLSVLFALIIGTIVANFMGIADFKAVGDAQVFALVQPFAFGAPIFDPKSCLVFIIIMILTFTEMTGMLMGIHNIVGKEFNNKILTKGAIATAISAMLGGIFNTSICTIYAPNVGLVELSKVKSRYVSVFAGIGLIVVSMLPKVSSLITSIPYSVLGGAGFAMFGIVAASGISILANVDYNGNQNKLLVALSLGLAMIPTVVPQFFNNCPELVQIMFGGGITTGAIAAIVLNIIFNEIKIGKQPAKV